MATKVVTLCGSMRFFPQMLQVAADETAQGNIVLSPFSVVAPEDQNSEYKAMLDRLHLQKIDMSEKIIVVTNQNGYVGESTRREMAYALSNGKGMDIREFQVAAGVTCESSACHEHCPTCHDDECDGECGSEDGDR